MKNFGDAPNVAVQAHVQLTDRQPRLSRYRRGERDGERVAIQKTEQPLAGVVIGFDAGSVITQADQPLLAMADCMTSGYQDRRDIYSTCCAARAWCMSSMPRICPAVTEKSPGVFMAYAGCDPQKVNEVVDLMLENIARLQGTPAEIQPDWFDRSKQLIINADALENETPNAQADGRAG